MALHVESVVGNISACGPVSTGLEREYLRSPMPLLAQSLASTPLYVLRCVSWHSMIRGCSDWIGVFVCLCRLQCAIRSGVPRARYVDAVEPVTMVGRARLVSGTPSISTLHLLL